MSQIDLNQAPPGHKYSVSVDPEESGGDKFVRLLKDILLFIGAFTIVGLVIWICYTTIESSTTSQEEKKWAMSTITSLAGGFVGYLIKK